MAKKALIVAVISHDVVASVLIENGAFDFLAQKFDLRYIVSPEVSRNIPGAYDVLSLSSLNSTLSKKIDLHFWYFSLFIFLRCRGIYIEKSFKASQLKPFWRRFYRLISHPAIAWINVYLDRYVFFCRDRNVENYLNKIKPQLIIVPGSAMDSYSHMVLRTAKRMGIPAAMAITHWDFFSKKGLLRLNPDRIYVWGEDMRQIAISDKTVNENEVKVIGSPQFDKYKVKVIHVRNQARRQFALPEIGRVVLFAGTSAPYDELAVLARLVNVINKDQYADVRIIYRPHPRAWKRRSAYEKDPLFVKSVLMDVSEGRMSASPEHYRNLMAAIDGIVSPFSTMILEGALCGKPSLCIGFSDNLNDWDFSEANDEEHIQKIADRCWIDVCKETESLESSFELFLNKLGAENVVDSIIQDIKSTIYFDEKSYSERLYEQVLKDFHI